MINELLKFSTISFDIFDTLLARKVEKPIDIFYSVRAYLLDDKRFLLHGELLKNFPYLRIEAEKKARNNLSKNGNLECEILLDDIYHTFQDITKADEDIISLLKETEIELEKSFIFAPQEALEFYKELKAKNKKIICISDMYLPKKIILDLLNSQGYHFSADDIFISGELEVSKHHGNLYQKVAEELKLDKKSWVHIGDNQHSDIKQAEKFGIKTFFADWSEVFNIPDFSNTRGNHEFTRGLVNFLHTKQCKEFFPSNPYSNIGYKVFGPLFFGFLSWFATQVKAEKFEKIFFFARDAQLFQLLYEKYFHPITEIDHEYIYLSRISMQNLSYTDWELNKIWYAFNGKSKKYKVREVLEKLNLNPEQYLSDVYQVGFNSLDDVISDEDSKIKTHILIKRLFTDITNNSKKLRDKYSSYFSEKVNGLEKIALVDIGWVGNMQSYFARVNIEQWHSLDIHGYYLSLFTSVQENLSPYYKMNGWISSIPTNMTQEDFLSGGVELLEFVLTANHGSTLRYELDTDKKVIPILEKEENESDYRDKAMLVRQGILKFFSDYEFLLKAFPLTAFIQSDVWVQPFLRLIRYPTLEEANLLGDLTHSDVAGSNDFRIHLAKKLTKEDYKKNPNAYQDGLNESFWKAAFVLRNSGGDSK